jgi:transketolase
MQDDKMVQLAINTIRTLSIDAVQQAKSGHPGTPMALAPLIYTIWNRVHREHWGLNEQGLMVSKEDQDGHWD